MSTAFFLIRHAEHGFDPGRLPGRTPGVTLTAEGRRQAERLAGQLAGAPLRAIYTSPRERARETAAPLAARLGLEPSVCAELDEIDFGEWTGRPFAQLDSLPDWRRFNRFRSGVRPPGGEAMIEVQSRIVRLMLRLRELHPGACVALVSHGDVLKAALAYFLGVPQDLFFRFELSLASVSVLSLAEEGPFLHCLNRTERPPLVPG